MPNRHVLLAAVVAAGLTSSFASGAPSLTGIDGALDSASFAYKYEGNVLPDAAGLGFVLTASPGIDTSTIGLGSSGGVDYMRIDTDTNATANDAYAYQITGGTGTSWDPHFLGGFTVEIRALVRASNSGTYGAALHMQDENSYGLHQMFFNKYLGDLTSVNTDPNNDTWHTFRVASYAPDTSSAGQVYKVWRDGVEIGTFAQNSVYTGKFFTIGDYISGSAEVNVDIDYVRWDITGAWEPAPIPEPASMGLLALGAGALLRRRCR